MIGWKLAFAETIVGNSLDGEHSDGEHIIYYEAASTMKTAHQGRFESGVWRIKGERYRRQQETFGEVRERRVRFYCSGAGQYRTVVVAREWRGCAPPRG